MVSFDMRTIIFSLMLINFVSTLVIFILWVQFHKRYKGITFLVYCFALQTLNLLLVALRNKIPELISVDLANTVSIAGIILGYIGLEAYTGRRSSQIHNLVLLILFTVVHTWFTLVKPDLAIRNLNLSGTLLIIFFQCAWLMLYRVPRTRMTLTYPLGLVFVALSLVSVIRIIHLFITGPVPNDLFLSGHFDIIIVTVYQMLLILLTFSLILMFSKHLLMDIRSEEEKFSTAFNTSPNAIIIARFPGGEIFEANTQFLNITGYNYSEILGKTTLEIGIWNTPDDRDVIMKEISESGNVHAREFKFRKKNGEIISILFSAEVIVIGNEKCLLAGIDDISVLKKYGELIWQERNLLRTLLDNIPDPVSIKDSEGRYLLSNKAHMQVIGVESQEQMIGKTTFDFFPEQDARVYYEDDKNVMRTGKMILDKVESAKHIETGFTYWHLTSKIPIKDSNGNPTQLLTLSHNITERKSAEDALKKSAEFNRSLLKTIPFEMDIVDENGTVLFQSENFRNIFGPEAIGKKCWELYRDDKLQCEGCPLSRGIKVGTTEIYESRGILGGKVLDIHHTGMIFQGKKALLELFNDVTAHKKSEYELIKSKEKAEESDRLKTAFLHNISHEIRTPMNAIVGFTAFLSEPDISPEDHKSFLEIITQSSNHLLSIVTNIIEISNIEAGALKYKMNEINLNDLFDNLYRQFKPRVTEKGIEFRLITPPSGNIKDFLTDRTKLIQIVSNLLSNSMKFTVEGNITMGYEQKEDFIEFFVSDTGIGIPEHQQSKIFERFYQVDNKETRLHEGTGLGLSLSKAYIEFLGGKIRVISEEGKGSCFFFTLPYKKIETKETTGAESFINQNAVFNKNFTILVAEDDDNNFSLITHLLSDPHLKIIRAINGEEAVKVCRSMEKINLVLMDLKMPVMDGYSATRRIKDIVPALPVIAQTAFVTDKDKALKCGCSDVILKPFNQEMFYSIIKKYLESSIT